MSHSFLHIDSVTLTVNLFEENMLRIPTLSNFLHLPFISLFGPDVEELGTLRKPQESTRLIRNANTVPPKRKSREINCVTDISNSHYFGVYLKMDNVQQYW
jgi:hypothetical protein